MRWYHWLGALLGALAIAAVSFLVGFGMPVDPAGGGRNVNVWNFLSDLVKVGGGVVATAIGLFLSERSRSREQVCSWHQMAKDWVLAKGSGSWHDISGWDLEGINLAGKDLAGATLQGANLRKADLSGATLGEANLTRADLRQAVLVCVTQGVVPGGVVLRYADLRGADLTRAKLKGADLFGAKLGKAVLAGASLGKRIDLRSADLRRADLRKAKLRDADMQDADLRKARMSGVELRGANLAGAKIGKGELEELLESGALAGATLPDGRKAPGQGKRKSSANAGSAGA
jgi:uncharacterized protein YjbI with pentapeptide repeats